MTELIATDNDRYLESAKPYLRNSQETLPNRKLFQIQFSIHFLE